MVRTSCFLWTAALFCLGVPLYGQGRGEPGKPIGSISVRGNLIVMTLDDGVLGKREPVRPCASHAPVHARGIAIPRGKRSLEVGPGVRLRNERQPGCVEEFRVSLFRKVLELVFGGRHRVDRVRRSAAPEEADGEAASRWTASPNWRKRPARSSTPRPAISVFFKPRMSGTRYLKELDDRAVITWSLTEPFGGVQDMSWYPTVNRFQAVLQKDGTIEMSYEDVAAKDAIVGVYPAGRGRIGKADRPSCRQRGCTARGAAPEHQEREALLGG